MEPSQNNPSHQPSARHTEEGERFNRTLFAAVDALEENNVEYALIGGVAASGLGRPRSTHDIDIFVRPEDAEAALNALGKADFKTEQTDFNWLFKAWKDDILVDIIFKSSGDLYFDDQMRNHSRLVNFHGRKVRAVSPEDLTIIKCAVHSEVGPHHWHDALAVLSHAGVDWDYLLERARRAPRRLLALLIYAQSNDILVPNHIIFHLFDSVFGARKTPPPIKNVTTAAPTPHKDERHQKGQEAYLIGKIREALAQDERTGDQSVWIGMEGNRILVRGESYSESRKRAIEDVIRLAAPDFSIENQMIIPPLPGPSGAEVIV